MKRMGDEMRNSKFYSLTRLKCLKLEYFNTQRDNLTLFWLPRAQNASREASMYYRLQGGLQRRQGPGTKVKASIAMREPS